MEFLLEYLSTEDFNNSTDDVLFTSSLSNKMFAQCSYGGKSVLISWQSELLKPHILEICPGIYAIGIDLTFAIMDFNRGQVVFRLETDNFIISIERNNNFFYVFTELSIYVLDIKTWEISSFVDLPDTLMRFSKNKDFINVDCMDGSIVKIPL